MAVPVWLGCDLVTGRIVEELPDLTPQGPIRHLLSAYGNATFSLPLALGGHGAPPKNWRSATSPGRSMIVAVLSGRPVWAGLVLPRKGGTAPMSELSCVTLEGYLDRRYVGDHTWKQQDEASVIAAGLIGDANNTEGIDFTVDAPATGTKRDRTYKDRDDKTVYSALRELAGVIDGPEWTVVLDWADAAETTIEKILRVRKRIGHVSAAPSAVFATGTASAVASSQGASEARYESTEDYSTGRGANHIVAVSSGQGETRPQSSPARDEALFAVGWPRYEYRFTPSTSITDVATLDAHAASALALMSRGAQTIRVTARADAYPMLGTDWAIGDDIGYELTGHMHPAAGQSAGLVGVARAVGWEFDPQAGTVVPILRLPGQGVTG